MFIFFFTILFECLSVRDPTEMQYHTAHVPSIASHIFSTKRKAEYAPSCPAECLFQHLCSLWVIKQYASGGIPLEAQEDGVILLFYGVILLFYGVILLFYGAILLFYGVILLFYGVILLFYGVILLSRQKDQNSIWLTGLVESILVGSAGVSAGIRSI